MIDTTIINDSTYKPCRSFFLMPRAIIGGVYPYNTFLYAEFLRLLQLYLRRDIRYGISKAGHRNYVKYFGHIGPIEFKRLDKHLADKGFISVRQEYGTVTVYQIEIPPLYNPTTGYMEQRQHDEHLTAFNVNRFGDFIRIPADLVVGGYLSKRNKQRLDYEELNTLLKLYQCNFLETYGGVDFHKVHRSESLYVNPFMYEEIYLNRETFLKCIESLINKGLVSWVGAELERVTVDKSIHLDCYATDCTVADDAAAFEPKRLQILRPYLQPPPMTNSKRKVKEHD